MVFINEWLPNPAGDDAQGEFIELFNTGASAARLDGWTLHTTGKKIFSLSGRSVGPGGFLLLRRGDTKLTLKNNSEELRLYDAAGRLADQSSFDGSAPEGESLSRINYATDTAEHFTWADPTPGAANQIVGSTAITSREYPRGQPLNQYSPGALPFLGMLFAVSAILSVLVVYSVRSHENFSKFIFPEDGGPRR
ncbi:MAG TPA: lamin tail domain-containing protein [Candidatus Paceibacterota bacterium]|nr:lamin tail domain-containing protein [Candidatus Paceibacterota bacterium]